MLVNREDLARDAAHLLHCIDLARACGALASHSAVEERVSAYRRSGHPR